MSNSAMGTAGVQACVIGPFKAGAGPAPLSFLVPHMSEGAERRLAHVSVDTLCEGAAGLCDRPARLPALHWRRFIAIPSLEIRSDGAGRTLP